MSTFDTALHDVFQGREANFSGSLRDLLRQLYERGGDDASLPAVGSEIASIEDLRVGVCFSNAYLRSNGQHRVVTGINRRPQGGIESVVTQLVRDDGTIVKRDDLFDSGRFATYSPYRRD